MMNTTSSIPTVVTIDTIKNDYELDIKELSIEETPSSSANNTDTPPSPVTSASTLVGSVVQSFTQSATKANLQKQSEHLYSDFNSALFDNSKICMLPNYNISPTGQEYGQFLVIDLGGSTLRIGVIDIAKPSSTEESDRSSRINTIVEKSWIIPNDFKVIDYEFFQYIGARIKEIIESQNVLDIKSVVKTGITWSFPLETTDYNHGRIVHVSKGYTIHPDIYGKDLKVILEDILIKEFQIEIDIRIIFNDSLAVYAAGAFIDKNMKLALVLGTGLNMCCALDSSNKVHQDKILDGHDRILYNTELSLFGANLLTDDFVTKYDACIDSRFANFKNHFKPYMTVDPNTSTILQPHELMASGRYLPELTRLVLVDLIDAQEIFNDDKDLNEILTKEYDGFDGELMCFIDESNDYAAINSKICERYGWDNVTKSDITTLKQVVSCIIKRAAFIVAYTILSFIKLLKHHNENEELSLVTIGYVGSVLSYFHNYRDLVKQFVNENEDAKKLGVTIDLKLIDNSSMIGAAIGAAYYS